MTKVQNTNVSAATQVENKKVKKQQQKKEQKVFKGNGNKQTEQKPNDSALKQEIYKKTGFQLKDTKNRGKIIPLKVNGRERYYETVGTLTTGGRILVKEQGKEVYHVVSHTPDKKPVMLKDDYARNKVFYETTSAEHKVKIGKKNYIITNSKRDRHGRMTAINSRGQEVILSHDGKELKHSYVEAEDQKDNLNDYIAQQTKGKSKAEANKIRQQIMDGNSSYSSKGVLRFKASNGEVWYYDTKRKTYVKYAEKEAQAIIKDLDKGAKEDWWLFRTGLGTDYELLKNTNAQIIDPEVLNKINKHYSTEYGKKVDKNAEYGSGKYKTAYEAFLASEIGDDEVYLFNATLVKNNAITDQSRRNEILQTNLTKISGIGIEGLGVGVNKRANRMAAADAASTKEDYQTLQDAAEDENIKNNYKPQFKGQDALQTYIYGVHDGDVQEIDDFNNALIDPKENMLDRDEIVRIKAETGVLWLKEGNFKKGFEAQDSDVTKQMFALQNQNGKAVLNAKVLKQQAAKDKQEDYMMMARPDLYSDEELAARATQLLKDALLNLNNYHSIEFQSMHSQTGNYDILAQNKVDFKKDAEENISRAYSMIRNDKILAMVKEEMGNNYSLLVQREQEHLKTNNLKNITTITDTQVTKYTDNKGEAKLTPEQIAHNKYIVTWLKSQLSDIERDKKSNEAKEGWKQGFVNNTRDLLFGGVTRASLADKYNLIKSNMARLEAAAEGRLVDASGKPVSFEDAMKNLGETGIQALEQANAEYQTAQQIGEFMVDMVALALPLPKSFNAANTVIKMGNALYKVISKSDKVCKVVKITQEAAKGSKIYEVTAKVATKNPKLVENTRKVATIMDSSATGAMHMAGKTLVLDATNIATSREGFTSDRISEMNEKVKGAGKFGGMGGAIGGTTGMLAEYVSSTGAKYVVHGLGLVADVTGAAGLMTAESHGETNFWDNLRCVNPDGSFNFEQATMTAMMIYGHLHGASTVRGKSKAQVFDEITTNNDLQLRYQKGNEGSYEYFNAEALKWEPTTKEFFNERVARDGVKREAHSVKLENRELRLDNDGIWSDAESGRKFRLAKDNNGRIQLAELTKKEIYNSRQKTEVKDGMTLEDFRQELKNNDLRGNVYTKANGGRLVVVKHSFNKYELYEFDTNNKMISQKSVKGKSAIKESYPEFANVESSGTIGSTSGYLGMNNPVGNGNKSKNVETLQDNVNKKELTALRNELGIKQSQKGSRFVGETNGENTIINEMKGNDTVNSYLVSRDVEGKAHMEYKVSYENGKAIDVKIYDADGTIKKLPAETKQAVLDELNKPTETDPASHSEAIAEEPQVTETSTANDKKPVIASEGEAIQSKTETNAQAKAESRFSESNINFSRTHEGFSQIEGNVKDVPDLRNAESFRNSKDGVGVVYLPKENATAIVVKISGRVNDNYTIMIDGKIPEEQCRALVKSLKDSGNNRFDRQQVADILNKQYEMAETSSVRPETHTEKSQTPKTEEKTPVSNDKKPVIASEGEAIQLKNETNAQATESNKPSLNVNDKRIQETMTIEDAKKLAEKYDNVEVVEHENGNYELKVTYKDAEGNIKATIESEHINGKVAKEIIKDTTATGIQEDVYNNDGKVVSSTIKDVDGNVISTNEFEYQNGKKVKTVGTEYKDGKVAKTTEYEIDDSGYITKETQKDADGNLTQVTEREYSNINGATTKETKTQFKDGKITEITETEYEDLKPTKEINKDADGKVTKIYDHKLQRELTAEEIKEYISNKDNNTQATEKPAETKTEAKTESMNNVEPTSTAQVKNLEKYDIMFQSKEGKALLDKAKKDPNFGKTAEERVPSDKIVKDSDGNIQSIEIDGVTYTRNEQGKYVNGDSEIRIYERNEDKVYDGSNIDKKITIDKENNKILKIESDDMTIEYDSNGQPEEVSVWGGESINLSTGDYTQDYGRTYVDPAGRVIENNPIIDINERKYYLKKRWGFQYEDGGNGKNGKYIDYKIIEETEGSLSKLIKDAQLENRGLRTTKKGRQKTYDDVRNQIEDAYNNSKIDRETADNLHAKLNEKAEANGLETQETPTMVAEREALAKWNEQADILRDKLKSEIEKVDSQATHDQMVEKINEACEYDKIDMNRADELYDALKAKAERLDGVETLSQKKAKIEKQVGEIETAQRIEAAEAKSRHQAELLDEYLAEFGENLPSEIGTKEYYDEALSTIDRGVKNGSIEPQKAEVLRTQLKEQLAKLESESNQPVTEPPVTEPPATEPPVTEPPATEPPVTEKPATEPPATEDKYPNVPKIEEVETNEGLQFRHKVGDENSYEFFEPGALKWEPTTKEFFEKMTSRDGVKSKATYQNIKINDGSTVQRFIDTNGKKVKKIFRNKDGKITGSKEYVYDADGKMSKKILKNKDGKVSISTEYKYNEFGKESEVINKDGKGNVIYSEEYKYDKSGNQIEFINKDENGKITNSTEYKYNEFGKKSEIINKDENGNPVDSTEFKYDANGKMSLEYKKDSKGEIVSSEEYKYNADGELSKTITHDKDGNITIIYDNEQGHLLSPEETNNYIKKSLENDISNIKIQQDVQEYIAKLENAKNKGIITEEEYIEFMEKAGEKLKAEEAVQIHADEVAEANNGEGQPVTPEPEGQPVTPEPENTPDGFPKVPSKPEQLEKKTLEEILGDEQAPKTADEAKKYAEEHDEAEFVASDDPNTCDMLFLDKDHDNIIYYNKDGVQAYREYNPSEAIERRDTSLYSDGTVSRVETRTVDGNLKVEKYDTDGNLRLKELYNNEDGAWTSHQVYFDSEGNMTFARKAVLNKETKSWEYPPEYEYNTKDNVFEQKNEKGEVESTVKYDEATEHWAEFDAEGKVVHEINKPEPVVVESESASAGEETPVGENSETADTKPSKISMFDKLFHRNKVRLENEVEAGTIIGFECTYKTQRDENGYVRTETDQKTNVVRQKEYFNAKGKKIKTEVYYDNGKLKELTEGNVTTTYYDNGNVRIVKYPNHKEVKFRYDDNGNLIARYYEEHNPLHPKNWIEPENEDGSIDLPTKRSSTYKYNSKDHRFELLDENDKVVTDKNGNPVGTATFDPKTRHWVEEGQYSSDLAPKTTNVSRGNTGFRARISKATKNIIDKFRSNKPKNGDETTIPKKFRGRDDVTYNSDLKEYTEEISTDGHDIKRVYDSKGTLLRESIDKKETVFYNKDGVDIAVEEVISTGFQRTEFSKDYDLEIQRDLNGNYKKATIKYHDGHEPKENGTKITSKEYSYEDGKFVSKQGGEVVETLEYDAGKHSWTIKDAKGKTIETQENRIESSHKVRNFVAGTTLAGVAIGLLGRGIYELSNKDDEDKVGTIAEDGTLTLDGKSYPKNADGTYTIDGKKYKVEDGKLVEVVDTPDDDGKTTKVTLGDQEGTIDKDTGTIKIGDTEYPKNPDDTYTINGKTYKLEGNKLVEVVDTPDDNGGGTAPETPDDNGGGTAPETPDVTGTIGDKEYIIKDGKVSVDGAELTPDENGHYKIGDDKYKIEDGKLVKVEPEEPAKTDDTDAAQSDDSQTGGGNTGDSSSGATGSQAGGRTDGSTSRTTGSQAGGRTGGSTSRTTGSQGGGRTGGSTSGTTGTTHNDTSRPVTARHSAQSGESRANSVRHSERSEESRHTGNTPVTGVTEPTEAQKQVAKTLQDEISRISTQADVKVFFAKLDSAVKTGQITIKQCDELMHQVETHVETLLEVIKTQNEQDAIPEPEFGLGEVPTQQEPQRKEKREITPPERMALTEEISKAKTRDDIAKIQQEMRQYKVFPGRKNLRRAYKAKLRAITHDGEQAKKYDGKFKKRMVKIENSNVYKNDKDQINQINREIFQKMNYFDDIIKRPKDFDDGTFNA